MKKHVLTMVGAMLCFAVLSAQEVESNSSVLFDGLSYNFAFSWKKKTPKPKESHYKGLGFSFNNLVDNDANNADLVLGKTHSFLFNMGDLILPVNRNWLFATGFGLEWSRYYFRGQHLQAMGRRTGFIFDDNAYKASKLKVDYATIPLLLEYQTKSGCNKEFFIYAGVEGLVKWFSNSKAYLVKHGNERTVVYKDLNLLPLNFRFTARMGYDNYSVFGYYQPYSMFESGKGPDMHSFGIGFM
ncbi:MAG: PorT family protein, partial [Candidatus Symbiothrix sp.]|nr:PorT family protein [Candidatus Symbiothrix sp.]